MLGKENALALGKLNLFPIVLISWVMLTYLLIVGNLSWYTWVMFGFVLIERMVLQLTKWLQSMLLREMQKQLIEELKKGMTDLNAGMFGGAPGPPKPPVE